MRLNVSGIFLLKGVRPKSANCFFFLMELDFYSKRLFSWREGVMANYPQGCSSPSAAVSKFIMQQQIPSALRWLILSGQSIVQATATKFRAAGRHRTQRGLVSTRGCLFAAYTLPVPTLALLCPYLESFTWLPV